MSFLSVGWIPDTLLSGGREIFGVADEHAFREALGVLLRHSLISRKYQDTEGYCLHRLTALFALHHASGDMNDRRRLHELAISVVLTNLRAHGTYRFTLSDSFLQSKAILPHAEAILGQRPFPEIDMCPAEWELKFDIAKIHLLSGYLRSSETMFAECYEYYKASDHSSTMCIKSTYPLDWGRYGAENHRPIDWIQAAVTGAVFKVFRRIYCACSILIWVGSIWVFNSPLRRRRDETDAGQ